MAWAPFENTSANNCVLLCDFFNLPFQKYIPAPRLRKTLLTTTNILRYHCSAAEFCATHQDFGFPSPELRMMPSKLNEVIARVSVGHELGETNPFKGSPWCFFLVAVAKSADSLLG